MKKFTLFIFLSIFSTQVFADDILVEVKANDISLPVNYTGMAKSNHRVVIKNVTNDNKNYSINYIICAPLVGCDDIKFDQIVHSNSIFDTGVHQRNKRIQLPQKGKYQLSATTQVFYNGNLIKSQKSTSTIKII